MKKKAFFGLALFAAIGIVAMAMNMANSDIKTLEIGAKAPATDVKMADALTGKGMTLSELKKSNGMLVIFSCNTCPFVIGNGTKSEGWENRYNDISTEAGNANVGFALVNPNEAKRTNGDSAKDMAEQAKKQGYTMPYLLDENHKVADAFGAKTTPHVFLFDKDMKLVYAGSIDDNVDRKSEVENPYLYKALKSLATGGKIDPATTRNIGCSIKRVG